MQQNQYTTVRYAFLKYRTDERGTLKITVKGVFVKSQIFRLWLPMVLVVFVPLISRLPLRPVPLSVVRQVFLLDRGAIVVHHRSTKRIIFLRCLSVVNWLIVIVLWIILVSIVEIGS